MLQHYNVATIIFHLIICIVQCCVAGFLCAMRVFEVEASSLSHTCRLPLCQISFFRGLRY